MLKRLYLLMILGASTAALVGCGGGGGGSDGGPTDPCLSGDASSDACPPPPPPDPCEAEPKPAECVVGEMTITSPAANSLWSKPEMSFVVQFAGGAPADLALSLNTRDVLASATIEADKAVIAGSAVEALLTHGDNTFEAKSGEVTKSVKFVYDMQAPRIVVTSVTQSTTGSNQQVAGDTLKVSGFVRDIAPIAAFSINDVPVTVSSSAFTAEVPYSEFYRLNATDSHGQVSNLTYAAPQTQLDPAIALQANNSIFKLVKPIVNDALANFDSTSMTSERIPFGNNQLAITRLDLDKGGEPAIDMHFAPSTSEALLIDVDVTLPLVGMGMQMFSATGTNPMLALDLDIASVDVTLQLSVSSDQLNEMKLGLGSDTPFALSFGNITVNRLDLLCNSQQCISLGNSIGGLLNNSMFRTTLTNLLNQNVGPALSRTLAGIKFPNVPLQTPVDVNGDGVRDTILSTELAPSRFDTDAQGEAQIDIAGRMYVANEQLPQGYKGALGSVYVDAATVPTFASTTAAGKEYDLGIALPSNFLNQAFLSLYQTGAMSNIEMQIKQSDLGGMSALLGVIGVAPTDEMRMRMSMGSVPFMVLSHDGLAAGRAAGIVMHLSNTVIYMDVKKAGETTYAPLMGMVADISADLELGIDANNRIDLGVDNLVSMKVVEVLPEGVAAPGSAYASFVSPAIIEAQIAPAVKSMLKTDTLPDLLKKTLAISISMADSSSAPLPLPLDMGLIMRELSVDATDAYLVIKIDLLDEQETTSAAEPLTMTLGVSKRPPAATP